MKEVNLLFLIKKVHEKFEQLFSSTLANFKHKDILMFLEAKIKEQ